MIYIKPCDRDRRWGRKIGGGLKKAQIKSQYLLSTSISSNYKILFKYHIKRPRKNMIKRLLE